MSENKIEQFLKLIIVSLVFIISAVIYLATFLMKDVEEISKPGKRFTYTDGIALYNICNNSLGNRDIIIKNIYGNKETDFKKFLLSK